MNLLLAGDAAGTAPGDWLLVHVTPDASTMAIVRDGALLLFRHRPVDGEGSLSDLGHQTAMYYEDRLGGRGLSRAVIAARDVGPGVRGDLQALGRAIEQRVGKADRGDRSAGAGADRRRERQRRRARRHRRAGRRAAAGAGGMTMLRTNLATRPFYNERLVHWLIGGAAVAGASRSRPSTSANTCASRAGRAAWPRTPRRDEAMARTLTARAAEARRRIDAKSLERISAQAAEANGIIDARTFSWTALFDDIEATLPPTVMLTSITPTIGPDGATVRLTVLGRTVEAIDTFIERLEATTRFENVQPSSEIVTEEGLFQTHGDGPLPDGAARRRRQPAPRRGARGAIVARPAGGAMMDLSRAFAEKRRLILPIAVAAIVNLVVYAVVIYPRTSSASALEAAGPAGGDGAGPRRRRSP